ncbi:MAG: hypothetical protein HZRFUVUK_000874 [Candidatus Fervidibacterota bacterium]|jgi:hypothetical protein
MVSKMKGNGHSILGSVVGIIVFIVGIAFLVASFILTYELFKALDEERIALFQNPTGSEHIVASIISWVLRSVFRLACLFVMGFIGSLIAARGAYIYGASKAMGNSHRTREM